MRNACLVLVAVGALLAGEAQARGQDAPVTNRDPDAMDVAKTPMTDLNLGQDEIPALLIEAQARPYALTGLGKCSQLTAAVEEFDTILGPDLDLPQEERERISTGRVAKWVVSSFIPFRGLIREISGANDHERKFVAAIQAGLARRGFLKGVGASRGCKYPASPATPAVIAARKIELDRMEPEKTEARSAGEASRDATPAKAASKPSGNGVTYTSKAVVQPTP
ncbi:hypothetical protein [Novosphingobium album (ex Liu et al. 2023)]|uniref:Uncharacterized protein n=1 Tax=Novosphingobium album (ex Liu et al. 2023) TaxID=3031130 RepID=A0ABT5WTC7_9SPHN|nr:hypothetical protein [Novosphingobium album (ex Liu et al. 2023)]MDE8652753.1 hypothetical protein [Novosphingobium album (ex Liu et al. 2023)]